MSIVKSLVKSQSNKKKGAYQQDKSLKHDDLAEVLGASSLASKSNVSGLGNAIGTGLLSKFAGG